VLPEVEQVGADQWRHIRMEDGQEGWMLEGALGVAEPWAGFVTMTPTP
jgi:SH3-like domain-containing protein